MKPEELGKLMKTSERLTESTLKLYENLKPPFTIDNAKQALFTFQGDAYSAIDALAYSPEQLDHAQKHLIILSGFYGILRPLDLMQPYRLEMGSSLAVAGARNLYFFWRKEITDRINQTLAAHREPVLINLASTEYSKVIDKKTLQGEIINITFKQHHKGTIKTIPIHAKRARGQMIHYVISNQLKSAEELKNFNLDGYRFNQKESRTGDWLFVKE